MYIRASAPEAPPFSETTTGAFIRLFFWIAACIIRAIWSEAPPAPAATTISTGLVGSQPASAGALQTIAASAAVTLMISRTSLPPRSSAACIVPILLAYVVQFKLAGDLILRDFGMRSQIAVDGRCPGSRGLRLLVCYLPFQFGARLLRNASKPSRKSSLI